jgi:hypothetical protein
MSVIERRIRQLETERGETCPCGATGVQAAWQIMLKSLAHQIGASPLDTKEVCPECGGPLPMIPIEFVCELMREAAAADAAGLLRP